MTRLLRAPDTTDPGGDDQDPSYGHGDGLVLGQQVNVHLFPAGRMPNVTGHWRVSGKMTLPSGTEGYLVYGTDTGPLLSVSDVYEKREQGLPNPVTLADYSAVALALIPLDAELKLLREEADAWAVLSWEATNLRLVLLNGENGPGSEALKEQLLKGAPLFAAARLGDPELRRTAMRMARAWHGSADELLETAEAVLR